MKKFSNQNVNSSQNRCLMTIVVGVALIVLAAIFIGLAAKQNQKDTDNIIYLNDAIESSGENTGLKTYLDVTWLSPKVAVYDDTTDAYYFAFDGTYYYIVFMKEKTANELLDMDLESSPARIEGITKDIPLDVKNIAIEVYNDWIEDTDKEEITLSTFYNIFGEICLDQTVAYTETTGMYNVFALLTGIAGLIIALIGTINTIKYSSSIKKLSDMEISELEGEMQESEAFYYTKMKLYLTRNYIIMLDGRFKFYKYNEVLWMYPFEQRYNGVRTNKAIKILTNDGKTTMLANMSVATKTQKAVYDEIWNTIATKNPKIKLGYTNENISYFNGIIKEIKNNKKNSI